MPMRSATGMCTAVRPISKPPPLMSWNVIEEKKQEKIRAEGAEVKGPPGPMDQRPLAARDNSTETSKEAPGLDAEAQYSGRDL